MEQIIYEFEQSTNYPLLDFLDDYRLFMLNSYKEVLDYYSGDSEKIDNSHLDLLAKLTKQCEEISANFENFPSKFSNCGFWELSGLIDDLQMVIEKINKFPKFLRTSKTKFGYKPYVQVSSTVGGYRTMEDVSNIVKNKNGDNSDWVDLMLSNDLHETDWEIDELKQINVFINNKNDIVVTTVLDQPIGERIYGIDMKRKITFSDNDVAVVKYKDNVEQKSIVLMELNRGDVPEIPLFGKNYDLIIGESIKQFSYSTLVKDITNNFLQNDLFESVGVSDFSVDNGSVSLKCGIKTKYDYKTEQKITI